MNLVQQIPYRSWFHFHHHEACSEVSILDFQRLEWKLFLQTSHLTGTILFTVKQTTHQCGDGMIKHQGGCHCGKVRFTTEYDPLMVTQCNCTRCRRLMGALNVIVVFGKEEIEFKEGNCKRAVNRQPGYRTRSL